MRLALKSILIAVLLSATVTFAEVIRQHGVHVHGRAELNIAIEQDTIAIELRTPAANILDFEHSPSNPEQAQQVGDAAEQLMQADTLFLMTQESGCTLEYADVDMEMLEEDHDHDESGKEEVDHDDHAEPGKDEMDHDDHADKEHAHAGAADGDNEQVEHSEINAQYRFLCENPERLAAIDVKLFEHYPMIEELHLQLLSAGGPQADTLDKDSHRIRLQ